MSSAPSSSAPENRRELDELSLRQAQRGDREALRLFVDTYKRRVFALVSRLLYPSGRQAVVEDVAQETFLRACRSLSTFGRDGRLRLSAWVLTIAARLAINEAKRASLDAEPFEA